MSNLTEFARRELDLIGAFDKEKDFYGGMTGKAIMELIEVFSKQGHSGMSASIVRQLFNKLADYKPLSALTFEDDEWMEWGDNHFQNRRNFSVFKEGKNGKPYYGNAYYLKNQNGNTYQGSIDTPRGKIKRCYIKDPSDMPTIKIDVIDREVDPTDESIEKPGSGWWVMEIVDESQLDELEKHYEVEYEKITTNTSN